MKNNNVIPFDLKKKYYAFEDLSAEEYHVDDGISAPVFESMYSDNQGNLIGKTKLGKEVLIPTQE